MHGTFDCGVLTESAFLLRYFGDGNDRLLIVNLGDTYQVSLPPNRSSLRRKALNGIALGE
jgi:hypothetical protein